MSYRLDGLRTTRLATAVAAVATIGAGENGAVTVTASLTGDQGNNLTIEVVEGTGVDQALAAAKDGDAIVVTLATDGDELPNDAANTATLVAAAVDALDGVTAAASGTGGTAIDTAEGPTAFTGGRFADSLDRIAKLSGFSVVRLAEVEDGRPVDPEEAARLAAALGTDLAGIGAAAL